MLANKTGGDYVSGAIYSGRRRRSAMDVGFTWLEGRAILVISGPERAGFLQGLVSNDVDRLAADRALYAAFLTAQGKYLFDFPMVAAADEIWLDTEKPRAADLQRRLSIYKLRAKVGLALRADLAVAAAFGDAIWERFALPPTPGAARPFGGGAAFVDPRLAALGVRCIGPRDRLAAGLAELGLASQDFAVYDRLRLEQGVPDGTRDLVIDKSILLEAGFDELNGVDWQKGCYIGQELTARTKYRGLIKRRLMPVRFDGTAPAAGAILTADGKEVGEMRSGLPGIGLALLRLDTLGGPAKLRAGDVVMVPKKPAWARFPTAENSME
jgi:folate-binding protein YgfZ